LDDRQVRLLVVLSAMVAAVGLLYAFVPRRSGELPWDDQATQAVWSLDPELVEELTVVVGDGAPAVVRRDGARWSLVSPESREADPRRVASVLDALARLDAAVPIRDSAASELGLGEPPRGSIRLALRGGARLSLDVGDEAPVGWKTYVRTTDGALAAVPGHLAHDLLLPPSAFREASLLRYPLAEVRAAELHSPRGTLRVSRDDGGSWWLEGWGRADLQAVDNLFVSLLDLRVDAFYEHLAPDGIAEPRHRAVVELRDGARLEARFGDQLPMGRLAQTAAGDIGTIQAQYLALLDQGPTDLLDRHAFPLRDGRIARVEVAIDGRQATVEGGEGSWRAAGLSSSDAERLLDALDRAGLDLPPREPVLELGPPTGRVRIHHAPDPSGAARVRLIELGPSVDGARRIRDASGGPITTVPERQIQAILDRLPS
jgi:hypothetical protein